MKIAFVSSEIFPYSKTGGLADVAGALPKALSKLRCEIKIFTPKYYSIDENKFDLKYLDEFGGLKIRVAGKIRTVRLYKGRLPDSNIDVFFIDCPHYFHRDGFYTDGCDEDERFVLFSKAVIETLQKLQWKPDVVHCNDWQTGLIPLYIKDNYGWDKFFKSTASVFTIHNIGYQGKFGKNTLANAEIDNKYYYPLGPVEFYGDVSFMKTGISFADVLNTVSETYAKEILTPEYGSGMENVLAGRKDDLYGILNGVDYSTWTPETDKLIPHNFSRSDLSNKLKDKKYLLKQIGFSFNKEVPLIGIVSRMAVQKGFDVFTEAAKELLKLNAQWVVLGSGTEKYERFLTKLSESNNKNFYVKIGYDDKLSHLIEAGADIFLMPSKYEPCGLNQIYSLRYGTVPVVRKTGGLADTIIDYTVDKFNGTGFCFRDYSGASLVSAVNRAIKNFADKNVWEKIQLNGMSKDFSWDSSAKKYIELYKTAIGKRNH
jgi:starch synthase